MPGKRGGNSGPVFKAAPAKPKPKPTILSGPALRGPDIVTKPERAAIAAIEAKRAANKRWARAASAPTSIFYPNALTRPKAAPRPGAATSSFVKPKPPKPPTIYEIAADRQALQLGLRKRNGKVIDPTKQPIQNLSAVPAWVRAGLPKPKQESRIGGLLKDALGGLGDGIRYIPNVIPRIADDAEFLAQYGSLSDLGQSTLEGSDAVSKALFGRTNEYLKTAVASDLENVDVGELMGALTLDALALGVGTETSKLAARQGWSNFIPVEVMMAVPFLRGPKYAGIFVRELAKGKNVVEASAAAKQAYMASRPAVAAYRNLRKAGVGVRVRAADSRTGRAVENLGDVVRDRVPGMKSTTRLRGEALQRGARMIEGETTSGARWIEKRLGKLQAAVTKLKPEMQVAMRMVAEQTSPDVRKAFHAQQAVEAQAADDAMGSILHQAHADVVEKARRYVDVSGDGTVTLSKAAPARVQRAWALIEQGGKERTALIRELGVMSDEALAARLLAPQRVMRGARWTRQEKIIQAKLEALPIRADVRDALVEQYGEELGNLHLTIMDAYARRYAEHVVGDPEAVDQFYSQLEGVNLAEGQYVEPGELGLPSAPGESHWIPGDEQLDLLSQENDALLMQRDEVMDPDLQKHYENMARRLVRKHAGALPENAQTVTRMKNLLLELRQRAIEAEQYRLWYENSAAAILREAGGDVELAVKIAKLIAIYSPRAKVFDPKTAWNNTGRALGALDEWRSGRPVSDRWSLSKNRTGKNGEPLPDWQTIAAQNALDGTGDWEGIKTNSFYSNFLRSLDEQRYIDEFGEETKKVTIDTWMRRAFRYLRGNAEQKAALREGQLFEAPVTGAGTETITEPQYLFMQDATSQIGDELGWQPHQAQAAIWTSIKAETEGTPLNEAGLDFEDAIRMERERGDLQAGVQTLFDPEAPPTGEQTFAFTEPTTITRFLRREYIRATGKHPTANQLAETEKHIERLPEDHPLRLEYERLNAQEMETWHYSSEEGIPFQLEEGDNVGKFVSPTDEELRGWADAYLNAMHRQAMKNGTQEDILRIRDEINRRKAEDPLEQAYFGPEATTRNARPEPTIETEPAGVYTDPRMAPKAKRASDSGLTEEFQLYASFARDVARTLPEREWPDWVKNMIRGLDVKAERLGEESVITPGDSSFFDVSLTEARVVPSTEVESLPREGDFVYHGTDPDSAAQIMEHRRFRADMGTHHGEGKAWFTDNPRLAARYADAKTYDRGKGDRGVVIVVPKAALPEGHEVAEPVYGKGNRYFGGSVYTSKNDVYFQTESTPPLENLPTSVKVAGETWNVGPSQELRDLANRYMEDKPWHYSPPQRYVSEDEFDITERKGWARDYEDVLDWNDPAATPEYREAVARSYAAFSNETLAQYRILEAHGYTFEFYPKGVDPYPRSPREAIRDLIENKHMYVYPTDEGFGVGERVVDHPLLELVPDLEWGGKPVTWNDLFRAVHDVFGHGKEGFGFRAAGEDMAWRSHVAMYSPEARPAMTLETRGQNSWVNFGPHGETNRTALTADTVFAEQKAGLPPATMMDLGDDTHVQDVLRRAKDAPGSVHLLDGALLEAQSFGPGSAYGHAERRIPLEQASLYDIIAYRAEHATELAYPQNRLGIWHDEDMGEIVLDVGRGFDTPEEALAFGKAEGQLSVWDGEKTVKTGLTPEEARAIQERLFNERVADKYGKKPPTPEQTAEHEAFVESLKDVQTQRAEYQRRGRGTGAIVGATDWRSGRAVIWLSRSADSSTFQHELAHYARRFLTDGEERKVASWAGAKRIYRTDPETGKKKLVGYQWTREAEEQWAEAVTSTLRQGRGPKSVSKAINAISKELRSSYRVQDMPDMPPHVAETIMRMFDFTRPGPKRGRLWGGEVEMDDLMVATQGFVYLPYGGSASVAASKAAGQVDGYMKSFRDVTLNRPKEGAALSARTEDPLMTHTFKGHALLSGDFDEGIEPWVKAKIVEGKIRALRYVRQGFLEEATPLPNSARDIPLKLEPGKNAPDELKTLYKRLGFYDIEEGVDLKALEEIDFPVYDQLLAEMSPNEINGRSSAELALELMRDGAQPVEGIVWVPHELAKPFFQHATGGLEKYGWGAKALKMTADMVNDYQKALVLFLHPAYVPMQLIGNAGMVLLTQGFAAPKNLWRAVRLHRELSHADMLKIDSYAGIGAASVVMDMKSWGKPFSATLGELANIAADLVPRRAAWINEARKMGYRTPEDISALLNSRTDDATRIKLDIAQKARDSIVDFDRLSPLERDILTRVIWFYPWLRGATRWSARFALDHPVLAGGLAVLAQYVQNYKDEQYGDLPSYLDTAIPVPGMTDENGNPYFINMRQVFTFTTPYDLSKTAWGFVTGDPTTTPLTENLAPVLNAAIVSMTGYDPYEDKEVPRGPGTFLKRMTPIEAPAYQKLQRIIDPPEDSDFKVFRRDRGDELANLFLGSTAPVPVNIPAAKRSAALDRGDEGTRAKLDVERWAKAAKWKVTDEVYRMIDYRSQIESKVDSDTEPVDKARIAAKVYAEATGNTFPLQQLEGNVSDEAAQAIYEAIRESLFGRLPAIERELRKKAGEE